METPFGEARAARGELWADKGMVRYKLHEPDLKYYTYYWLQKVLNKNIWRHVLKNLGISKQSNLSEI